MRKRNIPILQKFTLLSTLLFLALISPIIALAHITYNTPNNHFDITYTDDPAEYDANCTTAEITDLGNLLEDLRSLFVNDFGLVGPPANFEVLIVNMTGPNGSGWCSRIRLDPYWLGPRWMDYYGWDTFYTPSDTEMITIPAHELFHVIQCLSYGGTNPAWQTMKWIIEGQARMIQDKVNLDADHTGTDYLNFFTECNGYLGVPENSLLDKSYSACLFWNYITEKYGGIDPFCQNEPYIGVDLLTEFWGIANANSRVDGIDTVDDALQGLGHSATFEDVFRDFIVTNYVKDLTGIVPLKYQYVDDDDAPGSFDYDNNIATPPVRLSADIALDSSDVYDGNGHDRMLNDWAAHYYRIKPSDDAIALNIEIDQSTNNQLSYHLLVIEGNDLIQEHRIKANDFNKSIINLDYDEIVVIIGGLDNTATNPARYKYTFTTGTADDVSIDIESPKNTPAAARSRVGSHLEPEEFLSIIDVSFDGSALAGLEVSDFSAQVGSEPAEISASGYILGKYFLLIQAPQQDSEGLYDLNIGLNPTTATGVEDDELDAIEYNGLAADNVLVIDRSGSMAGPGYPPTYNKINSAITAAKLYVDSFLDIDKISVVIYNETTTSLIDLQDISDATRTTAKDLIDEIDADGWTSIGGGLLEAQNQLALYGDTNHDWVIILLSDGRQNRIPEVADVSPIILGNGTTVHSVAIGPEADVPLMRDLAYSTPGGTFFFASEPSSGDLPNDLADIYRSIAESVDHQQRILSKRGQESAWEEIIPIGAGSQEAHFVFSYDSAKPISENMTQLFDPQGTIIQPKHQDHTLTPDGFMGYLLWKVDDPMPGDWLIQGEGSPNTKYLIETAVRHKLRMRIYFPFVEYYKEKEDLTGETVNIIVSLSETLPVKGAEVHATITNPKTEESPSEIHQLKLFDDGAHDDGAPNDGVYGNYYTRTFQNGTYTVKAVATGKSPLTDESFQREVNGAFYIELDKDTDGDTLPDSWERLHGLDPSDAELDNGADGDPDNDGLSNSDEYYYGTNPKNPDTDGGGELDGSETEFDRDPKNPNDDVLKPPRNISVLPGNGYLEIYYSLRQDYSYVILYRSEKPETGYKVLETLLPTGFFNDTDVENEMTYYYKIAGVDENGAISSLSRWARGTPREDTELPEGFVLINKGADLTTSPDVMLTLLASPDTTEMKIFNIPTFEDVPWEPFENQKPWTLQTGEGYRTVYALFRDHAGNIADHITHDTILVVDEQELLGELIVEIEDGRGNPLAGVSISSVSTPSGQSAVSGVSDNDGRVTFRNVFPGEYIIRAGKNWYKTVIEETTVGVGEPTKQQMTLTLDWTIILIIVVILLIIILIGWYILRRR